MKSVGGFCGVHGKLEHLESLLVKTLVIWNEHSRHLRNVVKTLKLFNEIPERDIFPCDPKLAGYVDSVKLGSTFFHQVQLRGSKFSSTVIFAFLWNEMTRETCQFFLDMENEEDTVVLVLGYKMSINLGDTVPAYVNMKEMAGMDALCSDKTGTLTFNKLTIDKNLIELSTKGVDADTVVLIAARASRTENQDAIYTTIVGMLADPKEACTGIQELHFLPFNPIDKAHCLGMGTNMYSSSALLG